MSSSQSGLSSSSSFWPIRINSSKLYPGGGIRILKTRFRDPVGKYSAGGDNKYENTIEAIESDVITMIWRNLVEHKLNANCARELAKKT